MPRFAALTIVAGAGAAVYAGYRAIQALIVLEESWAAAISAAVEAINDVAEEELTAAQCDRIRARLFDQDAATVRIVGTSR